MLRKWLNGKFFLLCLGVMIIGFCVGYDYTLLSADPDENSPPSSIVPMNIRERTAEPGNASDETRGMSDSGETEAVPGQAQAKLP